MPLDFTCLNSQHCPCNPAFSIGTTVGINEDRYFIFKRSKVRMHFESFTLAGIAVGPETSISCGFEQQPRTLTARVSIDWPFTKLEAEEFRETKGSASVLSRERDSRVRPAVLRPGWKLAASHFAGHGPE
jgi:hypothetical protein